MTTHWLAVFLGGGLGSVARFGLSRFFQTLNLTELPWATLLSNVLSSTVLAYFVFRFQSQPSQWIYALIAIGFCGGFSTFSTFSLETLQLLRHGQLIWALANVLINAVLCISILFIFSRFNS